MAAARNVDRVAQYLPAATLLVVAGLLAFCAVPASAASSYAYSSQITEANGTGFSNPWGLAVDSSDNLWVFDQGSSLLSQFDSSGTFQAQNDGTGSWEGSPYVHGLAHGQGADQLYVPDSNLDDIWGVNAADATNSSTDLFGGAWDSGPHEGCCFIADAVDNSGAATDGDVYVANGSTVTRVDASGTAEDFSASASYISANQLTGTPAHSFGGAEALATDSAGNVYVADNANHEVDEFDSSGTFLRAFTGTFGSLSSIAVDPTTGNVLIGDQSNHLVHEFDSSGTFLEDIDGSATPDGSFSPQGLAVDSSGTLYVADSAHQVVDAFSPPPPPGLSYSSQITEANGTGFSNPWGLAVDSSDNLWVFDQGSSLLSQFDSSGTFQAQNDGTGSWEGSPYVHGLAHGQGADQLYVPDSNLDDIWGVNAADATNSSTDLFGGAWDSGPHEGCCFIADAVDNSGAATDGDVYVANGSTVTRVDASGTAEDFSASASYISANQLTGTPAHSFGGAEALATDSAGNVYVADNANHEVDEFDSSGTFLRAFTGTFGSLSSIAVDPTTGNVLIGDQSNHLVHEFDSSGTFLEDIDGSATPDGSFSPQGLAVDSSGTLYVADSAHQVVDAFSFGAPPPGPHAVTVTVKGTGSGQVDADSGAIANCRSASGTCSDIYPDSSTVTLTATADAHSTFTGWSGAGCSGTGDCVVSVKADKSVTATFTHITHTISVTKSGNGSGTVSADSGAINCGGTCFAPYPETGTVTLSAAPAAHSQFDGWSGAGCSGTGDCLVTVNADESVNATFSKITHIVTVTAAGSGRVDADSGAIWGCRMASGGCAGPYDETANVTLTATPDEHNEFTGWSGVCAGSGSNPSCTVSVDAAESVGADFAAISHNVSVIKNGDGSGSVSADSGAIDCGATCSDTYDEASTVTLSATPTAQNQFDGWSGAGCSGTGDCVVSVDGDKTVHATFSLITHTVSVSKSGNGSGTVSADSGAINCGVTCSGPYPETSGVTLTATPAAYSEFTGWSGAGCSGTGTCTVSAVSDQAVIATFSLITHSLTVNKGGSGSGSVSCDGGACTASYPEGTVVTLTATPDSSSVFSGFSGGGCSGLGACEVRIDADTAVTASFDANTPPPSHHKCRKGFVRRHGKCAKKRHHKKRHHHKRHSR